MQSTKNATQNLASQNQLNHDQPVKLTVSLNSSQLSTIRRHFIGKNKKHLDGNLFELACSIRFSSLCSEPAIIKALQEINDIFACPRMSDTITEAF